MNDYHWADIAEAPRDGSWIIASAICIVGHPVSVKCQFIDGAFKDISGRQWEPEYFVKEGKKP